MASQPALTSPDGSSNGKPPERCPRPLYSHRDPTQEDKCIPHDDQSENLEDYNIVIKEEYEEEDEEYGVMKELSEGHMDIKTDPHPLDSNPDATQSENLEDYNIVIKEEYKEEDGENEVMEELSEGHKDLYKDTMMKPPSNRKCPRALYSHPEPTKGEDLIDEIEVKLEDEETYVRDDRQYTEEEEEAGMTRTFKKEATPTQISTVHRWDLGRDSSPNCKAKDKAITQNPENGATSQHCPGERPSSSQYCLVVNPVTPNILLLPNTVPGQLFLSSSIARGTVTGEAVQTATGSQPKPNPIAIPKLKAAPPSYFCPKCGEGFMHKSSLGRHRKCSRERKTHTCPECGKDFIHAAELIRHRRNHTGEKPYSCPECDKRFAWKSGLTTHLRTHTGEKPFSCHLCESRFAQGSTLAAHLRSHTGEKPFACTDCGKCLSTKFKLLEHAKRHKNLAAS